jgi:hypothetical protein
MPVSSESGTFAGSHSISASIEAISSVFESTYWRVQREIWRA